MLFFYAIAIYILLLAYLAYGYSQERSPSTAAVIAAVFIFYPVAYNTAFL